MVPEVFPSAVETANLQAVSSAVSSVHFGWNLEFEVVHLVKHFLPLIIQEVLSDFQCRTGLYGGLCVDRSDDRYILVV